MVCVRFEKKKKKERKKKSPESKTKGILKGSMSGLSDTYGNTKPSSGFFFPFFFSRLYMQEYWVYRFITSTTNQTGRIAYVKG